MDDLLNAYFELHDMLSDMIEAGRLTEGDIPEDYAALVEQLEQCNAAYYEEVKLLTAPRASPSPRSSTTTA